MRLRLKRILVFAGVAFLLLIGWFLWQLFGPAPAIIVSKETTFITAPLRPDGLPDYEKYVLEKMREGVTPENNAAVLLWEVLGFSDLYPDPVEAKAIADEIGLKRVPLDLECLHDVHNELNREQVTVWLETTGRLSMEDDIHPNEVPEDEPFESWPLNREFLVESLLYETCEKPWTSAQLSSVADWLAANEHLFELIVAASERTHFYSPSPILLNQTPDSLISIDNSWNAGPEIARKAVRILSTRAMWHVGEGRPEAAWRDILATHRLARLAGQCPTTFHQIVAMTINRKACQSTIVLLDSPHISGPIARQIHKDLVGLADWRQLARAFDQFERLAALDAALGLKTNTMTDKGFRELFGPFADNLSFNWNTVLTDTNVWFNQLVKAASHEEWSVRETALNEFGNDIGKSVEEVQSPKGVATGVLSRPYRNKCFASLLTYIAYPMPKSASQAQDNANTQLTLTSLAAALAVYRAEQGQYPEKLKALVPDILDALPVDLYHHNAFIYRRTPSGYLLYSRGPNDQDDRGIGPVVYKGYDLNIEPAEALLDLLRGELPMVATEETDPATGQPLMRPFKASDDLSYHIPNDADDIAIRVPLPKLELPKAK